MARFTYQKGGDVDASISWGGLLVGFGMIALAIYIFISAPSNVIPAGVIILILGVIFSLAGIYNVIDYLKEKDK